MSSPMVWLATIAALMCVSACASESAPVETDGWLADGSEQAVTPTYPDPRLWDGMRMKPEVRESTLRAVEGLGNLAYRALRRLNVSVTDMVDTLEDDCIVVNESLRVAQR